MIYTLLIWSSLCAGPDCIIPTFEYDIFEDPIRCEKSLQYWMKGKEGNTGTCYVGKLTKKALSYGKRISKR